VKTHTRTPHAHTRPPPAPRVCDPSQSHTRSAVRVTHGESGIRETPTLSRISAPSVPHTRRRQSHASRSTSRAAANCHARHMSAAFGHCHNAISLFSLFSLSLSRPPASVIRGATSPSGRESGRASYCPTAHHSSIHHAAAATASHQASSVHILSSVAHNPLASRAAWFPANPRSAWLRPVTSSREKKLPPFKIGPRVLPAGGIPVSERVDGEASGRGAFQHAEDGWATA